MIARDDDMPDDDFFEGHGSIGPEREPDRDDDGLTHDESDLRNAEHLVERHGSELRYVHVWSKWLVWDGKRWREDDTGAAPRLAEKTARAILSEEVRILGKLQERQRLLLLHEKKDDRLEEDLKRSKRRVAHASKSQDARRLDAMLARARNHERIALPYKTLDADPMLLNVASGTIDLRQGELRPHDPADLISKLSPIDFDPNATCPQWDAFLEEIQPDAEVRTFLQRWFGYCLTGDASERKFVFAHGGGRNGKSVIARVLRALLGEYATVATADLLLTSKHDRHPTELADLHGRRLVSCQEIPKGRTLNEQRVKELTGNEGAIKARRMHEDLWEVPTTFKFWISGNDAPSVRDTTDSIWDRMCKLPFTVRIPDERVDKHFFEKTLTPELGGILAWSVRGCLDWQRNGLPKPRAIEAATEAYRAEEDAFGRFVADCCAVHATARCTVKDLNAAYARWCEENDERRGTSKDVASELRRRGCEDRKVNKARGWWGIRLLDNWEKQARDVEGGHGGHEGHRSSAFSQNEKNDSPEAKRGKLMSQGVPGVPGLDPYDDGEPFYGPDEGAFGE